MTEKIIPDGYKLVAVKGLDELVYWLDRCKDKGHLENCADLIEPFEAFEYRNVSEEAVIATNEAKAEPFGYFRAEPFGWTDCAATDEGAIALYERPAAPAVRQGWKLVPVEPTPDMEGAGRVNMAYGSCTARQVWIAMLAAAPAAPSQPAVPFPGNVELAAFLRKLEHRIMLTRDDQILLAHAADTVEAAPSQPSQYGSPELQELIVAHATQEPVTLTDVEVGACFDKTERESRYGKHHFGWFLDFSSNIIAALREKQGGV